MSKAKYLPGTITGVLLATLLVVNTLVGAGPLIVAALFKLLGRLIRWQRLEGLSTTCVMWVARTWMRLNLLFVHVFIDIDWRIDISADIRQDRSYMVISNHQSWVDIMALYEALINRAPFIRFFIKDSLRYIPILGLAWWGLDFPFMKRYSKQYLQKHPEMKGKDLATTQAACARFRNTPAVVLNFLEGTRFSESGHSRQNSPYKNLLLPRAGGLAFAISAMGSQLHSILNVTIAYPAGVGELWAFLCGRISIISVRIEELAIPDDFINNDYQNDLEFRARMQKWVHELWVAKDSELQGMLGSDENRSEI